MLCVIAAYAIFESWQSIPPAFTAEFVLFAAATVVAENLAIRLPRYGTASLSYPLTLASAILLGPTSCSLIAACSAVSLSELRERKPPSVFAYNLSQLLVAGTASAWAYLCAGGRILMSPTAAGIAAVPIGREDFPGFLLAFAALSLSSLVTNAALAILGLALLHRSEIQVSAVVRTVLGAVSRMLLFLPLLALALAQVLAISPIGFLLLVFPLVVARQVYQRFTGLEDAYLDTVRSLVGALEAKDSYTRGHSDRVAAYAASLATTMGQSPDFVENLRFAAQLHDLGKVAIREEVLFKPGRLSTVEYDEIQAHPALGADLVATIPHLAHIASDIRHHHERFDGDGYGTGLAGSNIPLGARILAVADSFDAMTTQRPYRDALTPQQAMTELVRGAGSQFDPEVVSCAEVLLAATGEME